MSVIGSLFEFIFDNFIFVIFVWVIISRIRNAAKGDEAQKSQQSSQPKQPYASNSSSTTNYGNSQGTYRPSTAKYNGQNATMQSHYIPRDSKDTQATTATTNQNVAIKHTMPLGKQVSTTMEVAGVGGVKIPVVTEEKSTSTLEYLANKAHEDRMEHEKEAREQANMNRVKTGGIQAAERLIEGEVIPSGKRVIKCHYCGAENLVPMHSRAKVTCYFCREQLQ